MKTKYKLLFLLLLLISCKEDNVINRLKVDEIPPGAVSEIAVENLNGAAKISYQLPDDQDVLYVEANYSLADGTAQNVKSSFNNKSILVEGFAEKRQYTIQLIAVDKSGNKSSAKEVQINPLDPPIQMIEKSLEMTPDFGGVRFSWENKTKVPMALLIYGKNAKNEEILIETYYSNSQVGEFVLRGQEAVEKDFSVVVRDKWDNLSARITEKLTPIYETKLDPNKFKDIGNTYKKNVLSSVITNIWDGKKEDRAVEQTAIPWYVSFDLGTEAKLSRIIIWQMGWPFNDYGHYYSSHNANLINIYGSNKPNPNGLTDESWTLLKTCKITKPSGLPIGMSRELMSDEDFDLAKNRGHEFIIPLESANVRYIRVEPVKAWETSEGQFSELEVFGAPVNK